MLELSKADAVDRDRHIWSNIFATVGLVTNYVKGLILSCVTDWRVGGYSVPQTAGKRIGTSLKYGESVVQRA